MVILFNFSFLFIYPFFSDCNGRIPNNLLSFQSSLAVLKEEVRGENVGRRGGGGGGEG